MAAENSNPNSTDGPQSPAADAASPGSAPKQEGPKTLVPPIDMLAERMRVRVNEGLLRSDLSSVDRNSINQLAGTLALRSDEKDKASVRLEYLLCFLEGDIDWKKRYKEVFGLEPPKESSAVNIPAQLLRPKRRGSSADLIEEPEY